MNDLFGYGTPGMEKFKAFHVANPNVYDRLVTLTRQLHDRGRVHYGIASLFEVVRWHMIIETTDEDFKLNNNYKPFYARLIMKEYPEFEEFFFIRKSEADAL